MRFRRRFISARTRRASRRSRMSLEALEARHLLAQVAWDGGGDGTSWHDALNWDANVLPTSADDVLINTAGTPTIEHTNAAGNTTVRSIQSNERLLISGGSLHVTHSSGLVGGGEIRDATLTADAQLVLDSFVLGRFGELSGTGNVVLSGTNVVNSGFANITNAGSFTLAAGATLDWQAGSISTGGPLVVSATARLDLSTNATKTMLRRLENFGTVVYSGSFFGFGFNTVSGDHILNRAGSLFEISGNGTVGHSGPQPAIRFVNEGTLRKTGTSHVKLDVLLVHQGTFDLQAGGLGLMAGGSTTTTMDVPAGASLEIGGTMVWPALPGIIGAGDVTFSGGVSDFTGAGSSYEATGRLTVSGTVVGSTPVRAEVDIPNPITLDSLGTLTGQLVLRGDTTLDGLLIDRPGKLGGTATITLTGDNALVSSFSEISTTGGVHLADGATLDWRGGSMLAGDPLVIANTARLDLSTIATKTMVRRLENFGTVVYSGSFFGFGFNAVSGDHILNRAGSLFEISGNGSVGHSGPQSAIRFVNEGTLRKTGTSHAKLDVSLVHQGTFDLQAGGLGLMAGGSTTTTIDVPAGASLEIGRTMVWPALPGIIGAGDVTFSGGVSDFTGAGSSYEATGRLTVSGTVVGSTPVRAEVDIPNPITPDSLGTLTGQLVLRGDTTLDGLLIDRPGKLGGTATITLTGDNALVSSFSEISTTGGVHLADGATLDWRGGSMLAGDPLVIANTARLDLSTIATKTMVRRLENFGTVVYSGSFFGFGFNAVSGDHILNRAGSLFEISGNGSVGHSGPQSAIRFVNEGTLRKTGTSHAKLDVSLVHQGTFDLQAGGLGLMAGGSTTTTIDVPAGASLEIGRTMVWPALPGIIGAGDVTFSGGVSDFTGAGSSYEATGRLTVSGTVVGSTPVRAEVDIPNPITPDSLGTLTGQLVLRGDTTLDGLLIDRPGKLGGTATITLTGDNALVSRFSEISTTGGVHLADGATLDWRGGSMLAGDPLVIANTARLDLSTIATKTMVRRLENFGTVVYSGSFFGFGFNTVSGDHILNRAGSLFEISGNGSVGHSGPQSAIRFVNEGTLRKTGTSHAKLDVSLVHQGTFELQAGGLGLMAGGSTTTTIDVPAGASLEIGGTMVWPALPGIIGAGDVTFSGGVSDFTGAGSSYEATGRLTVSGTVVGSTPVRAEVDIPNPITLDSLGTLTGQLVLRGDTTLDGLLIDRPGKLGGTATIMLTGDNALVSSFSEISTTGGVHLADGATLDWRGGSMLAGDPLVIANTARLDLSTNATKTMLRRLENFGTVVYSGSFFGFGFNTVSGDHILNRAGSLFEISGAGTVGHSGSQPAIRFVNEGTLRKTGSAAAELTVKLQNAGRVEVGDGTLRMRSGVTNWVNGLGGDNLFIGGEWLINKDVPGAFATKLQIDGIDSIDVNHAHIVVDGVQTEFVNGAGIVLLDGIGRIGPGGSLALRHGRDLSLGPLHNEGQLIVGPASTLDVIGSYTQAIGADLTIELGGSPASGDFGKVDILNQANLAGDLSLAMVDGYGANLGHQFEVVTYASLSGDFDDINGVLLNRVPVLSAAVNANRVIANGTADVTDLEVTDITIPAQATAGDQILVSYTVNNITGFPVLGDWFDSIYLSSNSILDAGDRLIGRVLHTGGTTTGYSETLTADVPAAVSGNYRVLVALDSRGLVPDRSRTNNIVASNDFLAVSMARLELGSTVGGIIHGQEEDHYQLDVPAGVDVGLVGMFDSLGNVDVYARRGAVPTSDVYDLALSNLHGTRDSFTIANAPGTWFFLVRNRSVDVGHAVDYSLTPQAIAFEVRAATPDRGSNLGSVTTTLVGSGFTLDSQANLVAAGIPRTATTVYFVDSNTLFATFDLTGLPAGLVDLEVTDSVGTSTLLAGFEVTNGPVGNLVVDVQSPLRVRGGTLSKVQVYYRNDGQTDIPAPLIHLQPKFASLGPNPPHSMSVGQGNGSGGGVQGVILPDPFFGTAQAREDRLFLGIHHDGLGGVLPPGAEGVFEFDFQGPLGTSPPLLEFRALVVDDPDESYDWLARKDSLKPTGISDEAWDVIFDNFQAIVGSTIGSYQQALDDVASYLSQIGDVTGDVPQLLALLIAQAANSLPGGAISTAVDAVSPAHDVPLLFARTYGQSLVSRFELGPLGRGWSHVFETKLRVDQQGRRVISAPWGDRVFPAAQTAEEQVLGVRGLFGDSGRLQDLRLIELDGTVSVFNADGTLAQIRDATNNSVQLIYTNGLLTSIQSRRGAAGTGVTDSFALQYNPAGRLIELIDHAGRSTHFSYDATGEHLLGVQGPFGTTMYTYESAGLGARSHALTSVTEVGGTQTSFAYDVAGRLNDVELVGTGVRSAFSYGPGGTVRLTDSHNATSTVLFNRLGQVARFVDAEGNIRQRFFNANHQLDFEQLPLGLGIDYSVSEEGLPSEVMYPSGNSIQTNFSAAAHVNLFGPGGEQFTERLHFRLKQLTDQLGVRTDFSSDPFGNLVTLTFPDGATETFQYTPGGRLSSHVDRGGHQSDFSYNPRGQVVRASVDGMATTYGYDARGNLTSVADSQGAVQLSYDQRDRLTMVAYPDGRSITYTYDAANRRTSVTTHDGHSMHYAYDAGGRLEGVSNGIGQSLVTYSYDAVGRVMREVRGNGTSTDYGYDAADRLLSVIHRSPNTIENARFDYAYDALGRRTSMATLDGTWNYTHDADGQLVQADFVATAGGLADQQIAYEYDAAGNRIRTLINGVETTYSPNNLNQYTQVGGATYSHDDDGNLQSITDGGSQTTYQFNARGQLTSITTPSDSSSFEYDVLGNRSATIHNGQRTEYLVDPSGLGDVLAEYDGGGNLLSAYTYGLGLVGRDSTGGRHFYDFDAVGSTAGISDSGGQYLNRYSYLPFGETMSVSETVPNAFQFVGREGVMSDGTGLHFMRARYYDPADGRFVSSDPIGIQGGIHLYRYAVNDPVDRIDPSGLNPLASALRGAARAGFRAVTRGTVYSPTSVETVFVAEEGFAQAGGRAVELLETTASSSVRVGGTGNAIELLPFFNTANSVNPLAAAFFAEFVLGSVNDLFESYVPITKLPSIAEDIDQLVCFFYGCDLSQEADVSFTQQVLSLDPNDIIGPTGFGPEGFMQSTPLYLPYTIRFENLNSATAPAQTVTIMQQLDDDLDFTTFDFEGFGFGDQTYSVVGTQSSFETRIDLRDTHGVFLDVAGNLDVNTGLLTFTFTSLDPTTFDLPLDPIVGFLPPNKTAPEGEGFIRYRVKHDPGLISGTRIDAQASIVFDTNAAIVTPAIVNTIDDLAPTSQVDPLPAVLNRREFLVTWQGLDNAGGAGVTAFDVYVSANGGDSELWQAATPANSGVFLGEFGSTYSFFSLARDGAGNLQGVPGMAVMTALELADGDFDNDGDYDLNDIDALMAEIAAGRHTDTFDLTGDARVDVADRDAWLRQAGEFNLGPGRHYLLGDANLNGVVDVSDFNIWNSNKFSSHAAWSRGDFNGDGDVDVSDFNHWNANKFMTVDSTADGGRILYDLLGAPSQGPTSAGVPAGRGGRVLGPGSEEAPGNGRPGLTTDLVTRLSQMGEDGL